MAATDRSRTAAHRTCRVGKEHRVRGLIPGGETQQPVPGGWTGPHRRYGRCGPVPVRPRAAACRARDIGARWAAEWFVERHIRNRRRGVQVVEERVELAP